MDGTGAPLLSALTTLRLGGAARTLVHAATEDEIVAAIRGADEPLLVLAGGSNVVVADAGFPGTVVRIDSRGIAAGTDGTDAAEAAGTDAATQSDRLDVQAGEPWEPFVAHCVQSGLTGVECLSGIPGSVGATPIQNVGAYGQEVADTIVAVRAYDRERDQVVELSRDDCAFAYRSSVFKRRPGRWVVLRVSFVLAASSQSAPIRYGELARRLGVEVGQRAPLPDVREAVLALRRAKGMVLDAEDLDSVSAGSFFTNPVLDEAAFARLQRRAGERPPAWPEGDGRVKTSAAWLIERAGFARGHGAPTGIAISSKHTLALTNRGAGTSDELVALAREIAAGVRDAFGVELVPEPVFVGHAWDATEV